MDSQKFVVYLCEQVLPTLTTISSSDENSANQLEIFKLLAEFCSHCNSVPNSETHTAAIMEKLIVSTFKNLLSFNYNSKIIIELSFYNDEEISIKSIRCILYYHTYLIIIFNSKITKVKYFSPLLKVKVKSYGFFLPCRHTDS